VSRILSGGFRSTVPSFSITIKYVPVINLQPLRAAGFGTHHSRRTRARTRFAATTPEVGHSSSIEASQQRQFEELPHVLVLHLGRSQSQGQQAYSVRAELEILLGSRG
jgi:hypothetical protein